MVAKSSTAQRVWEVIGLVLIVSFILFTVIVWSSVPASIPGHYNATGAADRWGNRIEIIGVPIVAVLLYAGLSWVTFHPEIWNVPSFETEENNDHVYRTTRTMLIAIKVQLTTSFFYLSYSQVNAKNLHPLYLPIFLGFLFGTLAFCLIRMYRIPIKEGWE